VSYIDTSFDFQIWTALELLSSHSSFYSNKPSYSFPTPDTAMTAASEVTIPKFLIPRMFDKNNSAP
jgi:hypothetical protein